MTMQEMYLFVKETLTKNLGEVSPKPFESFRSRSEHSLRVVEWVKIISKPFKVDHEALCIAALFHDVGRKDKNNDEHGEIGANIFLEYAKEHLKDMSEERIELIKYLIINHSDKTLLKKKDTIIELVLLQEADILDEEGILSVLWDNLKLAHQNPKSYLDSYHKTKKYVDKVLKEDPVITRISKKYWKKKQKFLKRVIKEMEHDLFIK
jgi:uncharacterized protein